MSGTRGLIPALVAVGLGIFTGYYTFQPAFRELQVGQRTKEQPGFQGADESSKGNPGAGTTTPNTQTQTHEPPAKSDKTRSS